jgi:hypothetical protein
MWRVVLQALAAGGDDQGALGDGAVGQLAHRLGR